MDALARQGVALNRAALQLQEQQEKQRAAVRKERNNIKQRLTSLGKTQADLRTQLHWLSTSHESASRDTDVRLGEIQSEIDDLTTRDHAMSGQQYWSSLSEQQRPAAFNAKRVIVNRLEVLLKGKDDTEKQLGRMKASHTAVFEDNRTRLEDIQKQTTELLHRDAVLAGEESKLGTRAPQRAYRSLGAVLTPGTGQPP